MSRAVPTPVSRVRRMAALGTLLGALLLALGCLPAQAAGPKRASFDHLTTGFELIGQHRDLPCESCHANAIFKGTPKECKACHGVGTAIRATAKPATHILATDECGACHTPIAFKPAVNFDHTQARGGCSTCHNGVVATGKPPNHIVTDLECDACHTTLSWAGAVFTHQGVTGNCASCHNGVQATGMPGNHIPSGSVACEACHSPTDFTTFAGAQINHPAVAALSCASCHETAAYLGMKPSTATSAADSRPPVQLDANHPRTGDCGQCHDTATFAGNVVRPANHIPTSAPCAQCHTTPGSYALYSVTGTHQGVTNCLSCHGPTVATTFANITITTTPGNHIPIGALDCSGSGCHGTANVSTGGFRLGTASINAPTLTVAGHATVAGAVSACQTCHESAPYLGMMPSTGAAAGDSRPSSVLDAAHPATGDCAGCHSTTPTFALNVTGGAKPANHIPTNAPCAQCHTNPGNYAVYSVTGTHQGVTNCLSCHGPTVATTFANITITSTPGNHIPIGALDCSGSGCHSTANVNAGGFKIGTANISTPTLTVAGHTTVAGAVASCQTCHEAAPYLGMLASTATTAADSRPSAALDATHPTTGDCGGCHVTSPTFASNVVAGTKPANHIPTNAPCTQCHTTPGNFAAYSVTGTHQGVTACLSCHAPSVATTFANITIVTTPSNHMPIGSLDCNGSGCHTITNVNAGGFRLGAASINAPTLTVTGHTTVAAAVASCQTCHQSAPYVGMIASSNTTAGDSRPSATLDAAHPASGDCNGCHTTTPVFATNQTGGSAKPANHIPTNAPCAQCHTSAGNYGVYSVTGTHQGITGCLTCHAPAVAGTFANIKIVTTPSNHIPIGSLDCNGSGCHTTGNVNAGGFRIGSANINTPTLTVAGHTTVAAAVTTCQTCHQSAAYVGMIASTATAAGDSRPSSALDPSHPATGDCNGCHTTTPTFTSNETGAAKPANHIPTSAPCAQCHTTAGNYALYVMGATGHKGITNNCAQCHAYGLSFYNMAPPTLKQPASGATGHIPAVPPNGSGAVACELCHSPTAFTTFAGTVMRHAYVASMQCMACHELGMKWQTNSGTQLWVRPSKSHHTGQDCGGSGCHSTRDVKLALRRFPANAGPSAGKTAATTRQVAAHPGAAAPRGTVEASTTAVDSGAAPMPFVHPAAGGRCVTCHNGAGGAGRPADHLASSDSCQACHTTRAWLPVARVDHTQVRGSCASCHNGQTARGKPSRHLPTSATCEACHTTNAWTPARFDHAAVTPHACSSCHNAVRAVGLPRNHIPTTQACDACHGTLAWKPVRVDHATLSGTCASCHNNLGAVGLPADHLRTRVDCAVCHSYPSWEPAHFRHVSAAYPGQHRQTLRCDSCHTTDTDQVPWLSPANAGTCAGCHAKDFRPAAHPKVAKGVDYSVNELANCTGACHVYGDATQAKITRSLPGPHHRVTDATFKR